MIAVDMDGTLLDSNNKILDSSKNILKKMKQLGKVIVIITGRSIDGTINYLDSEFADYVLSNNGAIWYSINDKKIIKKSVISKSKILDLLNNYNDLITHLWIANPNFKRFDNVDSASSFLIESDGPIVHCTIHFNEEELKDIISNLKLKYPDFEIQMMQDSFNNIKWMDILPKDNNKGINLKKLAQYLNIDVNDVIAFGDGLNDISMIKEAGVGVAMGNALEEVKKEANCITTSNDNDGIYNFLNNILEKQEDKYDY